MSKFRDFQTSTRRLNYLYVFFIVLCNSWDTELNPGPTSLGSSHFPCGVREASIDWDDRALVCNSCNVWYHIDCQGTDSTMYDIYNQTLDRGLAWECLKCGMPNFSTSLFDTMGLVDTSSRFDSLSITDSPAPTVIGSPIATSSPVGVQHTWPKTAKMTVLNHPLRILITNCQLIKNKKPELQTIVDTAKPDIILGCESWLSLRTLQTRNFFPEGYDAIRKNRVGDAHGEESLFLLKRI